MRTGSDSTRRLFFDAIVVGNGMIGSAASKYLSLSGLKVGAIGAAESIGAADALVYSSHDDECRVQRVIDQDRVWTQLNLDSVKAYAELQRQSGIQFHFDNGCLLAGQSRHKCFEGLIDKCAALSRPCILKSNKELRLEHSEFNFPHGTIGYFEETPSGYIKPRRLIAAQLAVCRSNGGVVLDDTVVGVAYNNSVKMIDVHTHSGNCYSAHKVLIAAGSFCNFFGLLPKRLDLILKGETVLLARLSASEAERLKLLPSLLYEYESSSVEGVYATPPALHSDGHWYLKMGCNLSSDQYFTDLESIQRWFRTGDSNCQLPILRRVFERLFPYINVENDIFLTKRCIISRTPSGHQYIGEVERYSNNSALYVAAGGCGYSAMCSDALGRISATLASSNSTNFLQPYDAKLFAPIWAK
jgi:glycine/D-amino acid oxidase-like deaminating enzyme